MTKMAAVTTKDAYGRPTAISPFLYFTETSAMHAVFHSLRAYSTRYWYGTTKPLTSLLGGYSTTMVRVRRNKCGGGEMLDNT